MKKVNAICLDPLEFKRLDFGQHCFVADYESGILKFCDRDNPNGRLVTRKEASQIIREAGYSISDDLNWEILNYFDSDAQDVFDVTGMDRNKIRRICLYCKEFGINPMSYINKYVKPIDGFHLIVVAIDDKYGIFVEEDSKENQKDDDEDFGAAEIAVPNENM